MKDISPKSFKKIFGYGAIVIAILGLIYFISHYAIVVVSIVKPNDMTDVKIFMDRNLTYKNTSGANLHILKRDVKNVMVKSKQNIVTSSKLDIPWYGFVYKKIELKRDKNADKMAFKSSLGSTCGTYSKELDRIAHYSCSDNPSALMYYKTPAVAPWTLEEVAPLNYLPYTPANYAGGLIGVSSSNDPKASVSESMYISVVSDKGVTRTLNWPSKEKTIDDDNSNLEQFKKNNSSGNTQIKIFTDTNQENKRFILVLPNGTIYLATPHSESQVDYKKIDAPDWYDTNNSQTICSLHDINATCFRGLSNNPTGELSSQPSQSSIVELSFENTAQHEIKLEDNLILQDFGVTTDGHIFGKNNRKLFYFEKDTRNSTLHQIELSDQIDYLAVSDKAYFIQDRGIFAVDTTTLDSHQIFYSTNIVPERLTLADADVFIIGKSAQRQQGYTYAWHITSQDNTDSERRLIDILPSFIEASVYGTIDLVNNSLYFEIPEDRMSTQENIKQRQAASVERLKSSGINIDNLNIIMSQ